MPLPSTPQKSKSRNEILIKGLTIALIGIIILLAPVFKPESGIGQLFAQSYLVGWFALVLGLAFIAQYLLNRFKK
ncbi:MAG: hypothetical protein LBJ15_13940 [Comamonas sp.]|jgi:uncharacterized membrane protein HdeD (DUF308 family)|uniref:hypothetical protein n=1 Tax=Comamonas sp. TaxID=34028 RepID=UPI0028214673|nr:hypothetical protein [Comamonas sp.]MDR0215094.1 hypothetical protein [Comamonas sp.]MDR2298424.1 hypothetical protein [Comamonas sp.]